MVVFDSDSRSSFYFFSRLVPIGDVVSLSLDDVSPSLSPSTSPDDWLLWLWNNCII